MAKYKEYLKSIAIILGTNAASYFLIKLFIKHYNVLDSFIKVPIVKGFVFFYDSWYPFIILMALVIYLHDRDKYHKLLFAMLITMILSYITFVSYPTMVERPVIEVKTFLDWVLDITYKTDTPAVNCLPSLHCIFSFLIAYYAFISKKLKKWAKCTILIYTILIALSTVFISQHVVEDIILAIIYTIIAILLVHRYHEKMEKLLHFIF